MGPGFSVIKSYCTWFFFLVAIVPLTYSSWEYFSFNNVCGRLTLYRCVSEPCQRSKMEFFAKMALSSILDVLQVLNVPLLYFPMRPVYKNVLIRSKFACHKTVIDKSAKRFFCFRFWKAWCHHDPCRIRTSVHKIVFILLFEA